MGAAEDQPGRSPTSRFRDTLELEPDFVAALLDTMAALVIVLDVEGHVVRFNRACEATTGYRADEVKGRLVWELFFDAEEARRIEASFQSLDAEAFPSRRCSSWLTSEGDERIIDWTSTALINDQGEVQFVIGTGIDITDRHQANLRVQVSEAEVRRLAEATFEGIVIHDHGEVLDANSRFAQMLGFEPAEVIGKDGLATLEPCWRQRHLEFIEAGYEGTFESMIMRSDGSSFPAEVRARAMPYKGRAARVAAVRDVTKRKQAEQELSRLLRQEVEARAAAETAVGLRDEFISVASHELRSPLTSLQLGVETLLQMVTEGEGPVNPELLRRALEVADRQAHRLARLVNDLLDISRLQSGRFSIEPEPMDLTALACGVLERFEPLLSRADCPVSFEQQGPVEGCWDRSRLDQCLSNLLANAVKYGAGSPVEILVERHQQLARLVVRDGGIGIPAEQHDEIFERFGRAVSRRNYPGLGLGLYIVRRIVQGHGGEVRVQSRPGEGTTFTVDLPYGPAGEDIADGAIS